MSDPLEPPPRSAWFVTALLAAIVLVVPPLLLRFGPSPVRRVLVAAQNGALFDLQPADAQGGPLHFASLHRPMKPPPPDGHQTVEFPFVNRSAAPVRLVRTWVSCGCVDIDIPKDAIAPGGTGKVLLHLSTRGRGKGRMWELAKVYTNVAPTRPYVLMVEGDLE